MRTLIAFGALALLGLVQPANAQMCGPGPQTHASPSGGMMCGMMQQTPDDPMADKPAQKPEASGMCPCCKNMAMMRGGMMQQHHDMPGMTPRQK
jgi:hypothetical protein